MAKREDIERKMEGMTKGQKMEYLGKNIDESDNIEDDIEFRVSQIQDRIAIYKTIKDEVKNS